MLNAKAPALPVSHPGPGRQPGCECEPRVSAANHQAQRMRSDKECASKDGGAMGPAARNDVKNQARYDEKIRETIEGQWSAGFYEADGQPRYRRGKQRNKREQHQ